MKNYLCTGTAVLALTAGLASADGHLAGEQVTVFGPWLGPDQETVEKVLAGFAEKTGADVRYVGSDSFEQQIMVD
jgi:alpha-glucoside transport system substrate-binding protein